MNFELVEQLEKLHDSINDFIDFAEEHIESEAEDVEHEYDFLEDKSGISNTELDNFIATLSHVNEFIEKLK